MAGVRLIDTWRSADLLDTAQGFVQARAKLSDSASAFVDAAVDLKGWQTTAGLQIKW